MLLRLSVLIPWALCTVSFILSFLLLFAGHKDGFLEEYALIRFNTSTLGYDLVPTSDDTEEDSGGIGGLIDDIQDGATDLLNNIGNNIADRLADELGISQWYSVHLMTLCRGEFEPNATQPSPDHNVTSCTKSSPDNRVNLTELIDGELQAGPLHISLAEINWPSQVDDAISTVNKILLAIFILYCLAIGFSGLAMITALAAGVLDPRRSVVKIVNTILVLLAFIVLLAASIGVTVGGKIAEDKIDEFGGDIGISADRGMGFLAFTWAAFGTIAVALIYWFAIFCVDRREKKRYRQSRVGQKGY
ncbi:actin cortical patch SUR7/pH-response regulator pali [Plectosphaerella plurivora]|uniref:Actin cortical patch SUR7/pH-response regulator pali n=1 Tax=Plectosphaerella plurivora TaxID=936078 RepID=A0A9P8VI00_9PEZI|nr:actin cortical patch SUR7/pH-response regulator pali [Plectosphaerella plurivora]